MKKDILYFFKKQNSKVEIDRKENIDTQNTLYKLDRKIIEASNTFEQCKFAFDEPNKNREIIERCKICNIHQTMLFKWNEELKEEFEKKYYKDILLFLHNKPFFPSIYNIFRFTFYFNIQQTKVVILGQDPYHNDNQAMGLSFSVPKGVKIPPSLRNIYKELQQDIKGFKIPDHGDLTSWAEQGVLLLNDILTVEKNKPGSHSKIGWKEFTQKILERVSELNSHVVFILWGNYARSKAKFIDESKHLILESPHPSPFSARKFFNCKHFSKANEYLLENGKDPINWNL